MDYEGIIEKIRFLINTKGLKQNFVAEKAGLTEQGLSDILNNRKLLRVEYIPALARALGTEPNDLFLKVDM